MLPFHAKCYPSPFPLVAFQLVCFGIFLLFVFSLGTRDPTFPCYSCCSQCLHFSSGSNFSCLIRTALSTSRGFFHSLIFLLFPFFHSHCYYPSACSLAICAIVSCPHNKVYEIQTEKYSAAKNARD